MFVINYNEAQNLDRVITCAIRFIYQHVKNPKTTLKQFVSGFYFSCVLLVQATLSSECNIIQFSLYIL